jgi:hypothetical protein
VKIKHNVPACALKTEPITAEYQAEVDRSTSKTMVAYERAQRRLASAERRLERAEERKATRLSAIKQRAADRELKIAAELVEIRRQELLRVEALMKAAPASAEHRGVRGFRPAPQPGGSF